MSDGTSSSDDEANPKEGGHARWIINDGSDGVFDAVIVTVGTCGAPKWVEFEGMPKGFVEEKKNEGKKQREQKTDVKSEEHGPPTPEEDKGTEHSWRESTPNIYNGPILHSSQLDDLKSGDAHDKTVVVVGSGASGVEAVETALAKGAKKCVMIARDDKVRQIISVYGYENGPTDNWSSGSFLAICLSTS